VFLGPAVASVHPEVEIRRVEGAEQWRAPVHGAASPVVAPSDLARVSPRPLPSTGGVIRQQQLQRQQS